MASPDRTYLDPEARRARLQELGLAEDLIREMVEYGLGARNACTALHPPSYPGYSQWAETHYAARLRLVPRGWTADDTRNFSRIVSPDDRMAFTVSTGDENTGKPGLPQPCTKHPRGPETDLAIEMNKQMSLFDSPGDADFDSDAATSRPKRETWTLLVATTGTNVSYELSLGDDQDSQGRITSWSERILFPPLEIDPSTLSEGTDDGDGPEEIDVPVERR